MRWLCTLATGVIPIVFTSASFASPSARLVYLRNTGAESCPDETAVRAAVAARLGYDPFFPSAAETMFNRVEPVDLQLLLAAKFHVGSSNTAPSQDIHAYWSTADLSGWELVPDSVYAGGYVLGSTTRLGLVFAGRTRSAAGVANDCP